MFIQNDKSFTYYIYLVWKEISKFVLSLKDDLLVICFLFGYYLYEKMNCHPNHSKQVFKRWSRTIMILKGFNDYHLD